MKQTTIKKLVNKLEDILGAIAWVLAIPFAVLCLYIAKMLYLYLRAS